MGNIVASQMDQIKPDDQEDSAWKVQCLMRRLTAKRRSSNAQHKDILEQSMEGLLNSEDLSY